MGRVRPVTSPRNRVTLIATVYLRRWWCGLAVLPAGCAGPQSALDPAGPAAASIDRLGEWMYAGAAVVVVLVTVLALLPVLRRRERRPHRELFLWGGGVALPLLTLTVLVPYIFTVGHGTRAPLAPGQLSVEITGHQFWWEVSYRRAPGPGPAESANELRLPIGEPVELLLRSTDVIHSLWIPSLAGKTDLIPGRVNRMVIQADRPGVYRGQCAEFCGRQHGFMALDVIAMPRAQFDAWLARLAQPVPEPATALLGAGRAVFDSVGCAACHAVRGVSVGQFGPDLTLLGSRRSIGAGVLGGGMGNIGGWIASAQHIKPGNAMPSFDRLPGNDLRALAAWLASLK
jgi:cytochrome c oxidase subunit 2